MMEWEAFEEFMWDTQFATNSHKIFQMLDDTGSGRIKSQTVLQVRREFERSMDARQSDLSYLKQRLNMVYGSLPHAWRAIFDPSTDLSPGRGYCCHSKFCEACRTVGFVGDLKETWGELTGDRGAREGRSLFLRDLDREADKLMNRLLEILKRGTKTPRDGWNAIMRAHGSGGGLNLPTFKRICQGFGFSDVEADKLFHCLQGAEDRECGRIKREQWKFLSLWEKGPPQYDSMMRRAHKDMKHQVKHTEWGATSEASFDSSPQLRGSQTLKSWNVVPKEVVKPETIVFEIEMTEDEYQEYLKRLRKASGFLGPGEGGGGGRSSDSGSPRKTRASR